MIRIFSILALALAMAFGGLVVSGSMTGAEAKKAPRVGMCRKTTVTGKVKTWRCKRGHFCCSAPILGYFGCGKKGFGCFGMF
ncbi:MAG: hypothetical protein KAQ88_00030 [Hyphomicrobiaceae bacterium]|nr:hypothetical protein [Hyphomicrobiaceae bacterium]